ncbi:MAG: hypothetical protein COV48_07685 [Elusimicrobia bacterium CG11_big_fil_rev_8_21_14_0_20_64_6]|nr:MAG: hypothetical protein COV48_07685 [Elusimicrobia bacterium CG11_big_fil_rev_8_21_14_0_20_64_6]
MIKVRPGRESAWAAIAAFSLTFLIWSPSLSGSFAKDDISNIAVNPVTERPGEWPRFFFDPAAATTDPELRDTYRPLASLSYGLTAVVFGKNPFFFHLAAVLGHAANAALVLLIAWELCASLPAAAAGAAWFAFHPVQAEGVSYISAAHPGVFALLLTLLALRLHRRGRRGPALAFFLAAGLFKESAVAFAPLFILSTWTRTPREEWKKAARAGLPYFAVSLVILAARLPVLHGLGQYAPYGGSWPTQVVFALGGVAAHARDAFWPYGQSVCYSLSGPNIQAQAAAGAIVLLAWGAALYAAWRRRSPWLLPLCWPAAALLTVSNIVPRPIFAADRFLYAALPGAAWSLALLLRRRPRLAAGIAALLFIWLAPRCLEQQAAWKNNFTIDLASYQATTDPCAAGVLAIDYFNAGDFARASALVHEGLSRMPSPPVERALNRIEGLSNGH